MRPATEPPPAEAGAGMPAAAGRTLSELRAGCALPAERLQQIAADLQDEMRKGLAADGCQLAMLPSHVTRLASGCATPGLRRLRAPLVAAAAAGAGAARRC
jgi:hexokinase